MDERSTDEWSYSSVIRTFASVDVIRNLQRNLICFAENEVIKLWKYMAGARLIDPVLIVAYNLDRFEAELCKVLYRSVADIPY